MKNIKPASVRINEFLDFLKFNSDDDKVIKNIIDRAKGILISKSKVYTVVKTDRVNFIKRNSNKSEYYIISFRDGEFIANKEFGVKSTFKCYKNDVEVKCKESLSEKLFNLLKDIHKNN